MASWNDITIKVQIVDDDDAVIWGKIVDSIRNAVKYSDTRVIIESKETFGG